MPVEHSPTANRRKTNPLSFVNTNSASKRLRLSENLTQQSEKLNIESQDTMGTPESANDMFRQLLEGQAAIKKSNQSILEAINTLKSDNITLKKSVTTLQNTVSYLKSENSRLDIEIRKQNIIINGIKDFDGETKQELMETITNLLEEKLFLPGIKLDTAERIPRNYIASKTRPVKIRCLSHSNRNSIMESRDLLKDEESTQLIYLNDDLPKDVRIDRGILRRRMKEAIANKHTWKISYQHNTIEVEGKLYKVIDGELKEAKPKSSVTQTYVTPKPANTSTGRSTQ